MKTITILFSCDDLEIDIDKFSKRFSELFISNKWKINFDNITPCDDVRDFDYSLEITAYEYSDESRKEVSVGIEFVDQLNRSDFNISVSEPVEYNTDEVEGIIEELLGYFAVTYLPKLAVN